jgi:hypothetical protein
MEIFLFVLCRFSSLHNVPQEPKLAPSRTKETNVIDLITPSIEPNQKTESIQKLQKFSDTNHIQQKGLTEKQTTMTAEQSNRNTKVLPSKAVSASIMSLFAGCTSQKLKQTSDESPNESQRKFHF